ncbi:MAG: TonB-dependent receptor plug domain-containing protein [Ignavibacteriaceae bacterium]|nr:TonB-dependent receptor plug domain-containing protein [Ignavibacteriaceae bacterium]
MMKILYAFLFLFPCLAFANTTPGDSIKYVFDEVSVIGKSTRGDLKKVTSSIEKVEIDEGSSKSLVNAVKNIPGIFLQQRGGGETLTKITMRGFGARSNDPQIVGIKILIDGFPETEPDGRTSLDLLDVSAFSQIEIGKTNSYNLFSAASGGYLNFISERNFPGSFSENRFTFGSFGYQKFQTEAGGKLKNGSVFVNVSNTKFDGWRQHSATYSTNFNFYLKNQLDDLSSFNLSVVGVSSIYKIAGALTASQLEADQSQANPTFLQRDERRTNKVLRIGLAYQKYFDEEQSISASFFVSPKTLMRSQKNSYRDFNRIHLGGKVQYNFVKKYSEEDVNKFSLGIDNQYQNGPSVFYSLSSSNERGTTLKQNKNEGGLNYGIYLHDEHTYKKITIDISLRYSQAKYLLDDFINPELSDKITLNALTPGVGISFALNENNYVMVHYTKGVENPAFNEVDPPADLVALTGLNPLLKPSTSHTIEAGLKGDCSPENSFVSSFSYNVIGYSLLTYDELIPYQVSGASYYVSAGKTKRYGIEASVSLSTKYYFEFESSVTLAKNSFVNFSNAAGNYAGKTIPGVPARTVFLNVGYKKPALPFINLQYSNFSQLYIDNANSVSAGSYDKFDLQVLFNWVMNSVSVNCSFEVENIFNKKYISSVFVNGSNGEYFEPGLPRNLHAGISLNYQF